MSQFLVAQAASRRFCAALAGFAPHLETHATLSVVTLGQPFAASSIESRIAGKPPALRFGFSPCA
jgi:hypothetical protein